MWIVLVAILVVVALAIQRMRGATIFISGPFGFTAFGCREVLVPVKRDRFERILRAFLRAEIFDNLHASTGDDAHSGLALSHKDGLIELSCTFLALKEPDRILEFRDGMSKFGYPLTEARPWNVGLGVDMECVTLKYEADASFDSLIVMIDRTLVLLDGGPKGNLYVSVWRTSDGPHGTGIKVVPPQDLLGQVP